MTDPISPSIADFISPHPDSDRAILFRSDPRKPHLVLECLRAEDRDNAIWFLRDAIQRLVGEEAKREGSRAGGQT
jgi:hypothetical protein